MRNRVLKSNLPGLLTISLCLLVQAVQLVLRIDVPRTYHLAVGRFDTEVVLNLGLLVALPLIGAIGSFVARYLGEPAKFAARAVLSPVALVSAMLIALLLFDLITARALLSSLEYSSGIVMGWVLIPAAALLLGGLAGWNFPLVRERARG
jgi:hypothetical protein